MNSESELWGERHRLDSILANFNLDVFQWLCLEASPHWYRWDYALGHYLYKGVTIEKYWDKGAYLPDISDSRMHDADDAIRAAGLVCQVDSAMAKEMIRERLEYDNEIYQESDLVGMRVLSASGIAIWEGVRGLQGYWKGFRFIKTLSLDYSTESWKVFHAPREFRPELLCEVCAEAHRNHGSDCFREVGPWFKPATHLWLSGWRLICPHAV